MRTEKIAVVLAGCLLLSACGQGPFVHALERTVLMETLGVDVGTDRLDGVAVTASAGGRRAAGTREAAPATVLTAQADTISGACQKMQGEGTEFLFYGDVEQLLVGEEQARRSLDGVLAHLGRDPELRLEAQLWVVRGATAEAALRGGGATARLEAMRRDAALSPVTLPKTAREALSDLARCGCSFAPALSVQAAADGATVLAPAGYAIFKDGALAGWAEGEAARGVALLLGRVERDTVELMTPDCSRVALELTESGVGYRPVLRNGRITGLNVSCRIEARVAEARGDCALDGETLTWLETRLEALVQGRMAAAATLAQVLRSDFMNFEGRALLAAPWHKAAIEAQWGRAFPKMPIGVKAEVRVRR